MFEISDWSESTPAGDPLPAMHEAAVGLPEQPLDGWTADALSARLVGLAELRDRVDAELARVTARWHRARAWEADGALSPVAWLTRRAPLGVPEARHLVKVAKVVQSAPQLGDALAAGRTTTAHVGAMARVVSRRRRELLADHAEVLAKQAERLSISDYTVLARRWAALADDHLAADGSSGGEPRNEVRAAVTMDGWVDGTFHLDPVAGNTLLAALDHLAPPDPADAPDGVRSLAERRGDALGDLASWYRRGGLPGGNPPTLEVIVDVATLAGGDVDLAQRRCDVEGIGPVTRATLERIGCGAALSRLVMAGPSIVLDLGRRTRLATPAQTRAVRARDRGCVFYGCDRPAPWCDIHHLDGFASGGRTDLANLACLCARHHTMVHETEWTLRRHPDGTFTTCHPARAP